MFGFLKRKAPEDSVATLRSLADTSIIESVCENGLYVAFFIRLPASCPAPVECFKNQTSLAAFVEIIEARIENGEYEPRLEELNYERGYPVQNHDADKASALRCVFHEQDKLVFKWAR